MLARMGIPLNECQQKYDHMGEASKRSGSSYLSMFLQSWWHILYGSFELSAPPSLPILAGSLSLSCQSMGTRKACWS